MFASPLAVDDAGAMTRPVAKGARRVLVADGSGDLTALDPLSGAKAWSLALPAPPGEQAFPLSTPVVFGHRVVVAYHTIAAGSARPTVVLPRLPHRVAVIDLQTHAVDPAFPIVDVAATVNGRFGDVVFTAGHALQRGALAHVVPKGATDGRVYVMYGNARDIQPYHGWLLELGLDAWRAGGAAKAIAAARTTTEDTDCGTEGGDGAGDTRCGAGLRSAGGPLVTPEGDSYTVTVPVGNGQLDLARGDYANTLLRFGPGLTLETGCDAAKCAAFSSATLPLACVDTCRDVFVPRLLAGEAPPAACGTTSLYECWALRAQLDGGSTPALVTLPSGKRLLVYPTKDGYLWLIDAVQMGRVYAHTPISGPCGAEGDPCAFDWAGTIVTRPVVTRIGNDPAVLVPTFVGDATHPAGVVAVKVVEDAAGPRFETVWQMPPFDSDAAKTRFRRHPSRATLAVPTGREEHAFIVEAAPPGGTGRLLAIRTRDGKLGAEVDLAGPGIRYSAPLFEGQTVFAASCASDGGEGILEAYDIAAP